MILKIAHPLRILQHQFYNFFFYHLPSTNNIKKMSHRTINELIQYFTRKGGWGNIKKKEKKKKSGPIKKEREK